MQSPPISQVEIDARIDRHIDELLELWWAEQGASKPKDLKLMASAIPFPRGQAIRALDLCCGPGDVGRALRQIYPKAHIDGIDRDPFLTSICRAVNQRDRIPGTLVVRDLKDDGWLAELPGNYDVVATVNALHWFDAERAAQLVEDVHGTLTGGGLFLLAEPACPETPFVSGFEQWKAEQPPRYTRENRERFWARANELLGYDHTTLLGPRHANRIGDGLSVAGWIRLLERAGFELVDVLLRDADQVIIAALKSSIPMETKLSLRWDFKPDRVQTRLHEHGAPLGSPSSNASSQGDSGNAMKRLWTIVGVRDVPASFKWYQSLFGQPDTRPSHDHFGQILDTDGTVLLCLHQWGAHEHPSLLSPDVAPPGNGLLLFFRLDDFDRALKRARALVTRLEEEPHVNPNTQTREFSLLDPDGYYVTISALPRQ